MSFAPHRVDERSATLRTFRALVVLLTISNVVIGGIGVYLLRQVDNRYSRLVNRAVPSLNHLRELMSDTVLAMRRTNPRYFAGTASPHAETIDSIRKTHQKAIDVRGGVLAEHDLEVEHDSVNEIRRTGLAFDAAVREVMEIYASGDLDGGVRVREESLLPAFDQHLAAIATASDSLEKMSLSESKEYSNATNTLSTFVLSVASWPVLMLALLFLAMAVFVVMVTASFCDDGCEEP
jgi:hypothetical protein